MDAIDDNDTDRDTDGVETCTMEKTKDQSITQELQNNLQCRYAVYTMHTPHLHTCSLYYTYIALAPTTLYADACGN